jgi:CDGSH-type Zn-finger protein
MSSVDTPAQTTGAAIEVPIETGKTYWWCACGRSRAQPFCDGSHKGTSFAPLPYKATETASKSFCVCKQTLTPPLCDGTQQQCGNRGK